MSEPVLLLQKRGKDPVPVAHETSDATTTYAIGIFSLCTAKLLEHKEDFDNLAQIAHDVTMIVACILIVGRLLYDVARISRKIYRWLKHDPKPPLS